ncbi:hypothetical protein GIJ05_14230 [Laceyella tengchongensis]|nr:hypothetical protein [Laceyella tengchongensis]
MPDQVKLFCQSGYQVYVETGAGNGSGFSDKEYQEAGAEIVSTSEAWSASPFVVKFKSPGPHEYDYLHPDMNVGAFFHAEGNPELTKVLCDCGVTAYAFEFFRTMDGFFPMSFADSEIEGKMAVLYGAYHLQSHLGGSGVLLTDVVGVKQPKVVVIGYGTAGGAAVRLAVALGAEVVVLGTNQEKLRRFQATVPPSVRCLVNSQEVLARELNDADLVIGAIQISTYDTPPMIDEELVKMMKPGSMIVDVTCGYGSGYLPTFSQFTSFNQPVYERFGVLHCKIDLLPAAVPATTTRAVSPLVAPYLLNLGESIFNTNFFDGISAAGKIIENGKIVHYEVARHMEMVDQEGAQHV